MKERSLENWKTGELRRLAKLRNCQARGTSARVLKQRKPAPVLSSPVISVPQVLQVFSFPGGHILPS
jgi:hypothetical protein